MITINVLAAGELFQLVLNAIAAFLKQDSFAGLLRITALAGIVVATGGFLKTRDPMVFGRWVLGYMLFFNVIILPKTTVEIYDITTQKSRIVDNIPVVFALSTSLITTVGFGLAQSFDALFAILPLGNNPVPEDLLYTKTGSLFGARLIQASTSFRIIDPVLKEEMNQYFRSCVVGDIRLNRKYSVGDLATSTNLWDLISSHASPLRMTMVDGKIVACSEAAKADGQYSLRKKLDAEIKQAYSFFGVKLFGKPEHTTYEQLFETHLKSAFNYYQGLTDASSNIFMQSMMINAMGDGIGNYQAFTDSTAGVVNQQFTKSQVQHRWSWEIGGIKALWFLPLLHTWLTLLLFGVFPLVFVLATVPGGLKIIGYYFQFFLSLQFWPVLFAILNAGMTFYGSNSSGEYGQFSMVNLDKIDELHNDISGAAGYIMMLIPFIAYGFASNLGAAFSNLATSMTGHVQGSTMAAAGEAANASFGIGQTSFYNTTANSMSANKHDSNWSHMHGMHTEQLGSGVLKTQTGNGQAVFDAGPGMSRGVLSINTSDALSGSMNEAYESSKQAAFNESQHFQSSLSNFAHRAVQLSQLEGHDMRLGDGVSTSESGQYTQALSTMTHIASDVAKRMGISQEDAFAHLTAAGMNAHAGVSSNKSLIGRLGSLAFGAQGGIDGHTKFDRSATSSDRAHNGSDTGVSAKEASDFNKAFNYVDQFVKSHHFDDSHSKGASLSNQMGADLRDAQTASHNYDASMSRSERIHNAKSYVESQGSQITANLDQTFPAYVAHRFDENVRDSLFAHPGDAASIQKLQSLGHDFVAQKRDEIIEQYGNTGRSASIDALYQKNAGSLQGHESTMGSTFKKNSETLADGASALDTGFNEGQGKDFKQIIQNQVARAETQTMEGGEVIKTVKDNIEKTVANDLSDGKARAQKNIYAPKALSAFDLHKKD